MRPTLFSFALAGNEFHVHTYGILIAIGFVIGIWLAVREARKVGERPDLVLDLCFWILVAGLVGARLLYVITTAPEYWSACVDGEPGRGLGGALWDCTRVLHVWEGGLVFYGGLVGAVLAVVLFVRRHRLDFFRTADVIIPSLSIGHFFGRLGCYSAGCCFGYPTGGAWGARFPPGSLAYGEMLGFTRQGRTPPLHPTELYEAAGELALFFFLLWLRRRKRHDGQVFLTYLVLYPILRSTVEIFRGDFIRKFVVEIRLPWLARALGLPPGEPSFLSTSQFISLLTIGAAIGVAVHLRRRAVRVAESSALEESRVLSTPDSSP